MEWVGGGNKRVQLIFATYFCFQNLVIQVLQARLASKVMLPRCRKVGLLQQLGYPGFAKYVYCKSCVTQMLQVRCFTSNNGLPIFFKFGLLQKFGQSDLTSQACFKSGSPDFASQVCLKSWASQDSQARFTSTLVLPRCCKLGVIQKLGKLAAPSDVCFNSQIRHVPHVSLASEIRLPNRCKLGSL